MQSMVGGDARPCAWKSTLPAAAADNTACQLVKENVVAKGGSKVVIWIL